MQTRRDLLKTGGLVLGSLSLAGCADVGFLSGDQTGPAAAAAAEWNAMRARAFDALALGRADEYDRGATIAQDVFAKFEQAGGEWGAHERLEETSREDYEEFEEAIGELAQEGLGGHDLERARTETRLVGEHLRSAQVSVTDAETAAALDLYLFASRAQDAAWLLEAGKQEAAAAAAEGVAAAFEDSDASTALEEAPRGSARLFAAGLDGLTQAVDIDDRTTARKHADEVLTTAADGAASIVAPEVAGAGHLAAMQAQGYDAAVLASLGGPGTAFADAAALNAYRLRVHDAAWLAAAGETDRAKTIVQDVFAHFEGARAHEALEEGDHDAYEGFEGGLADLTDAIDEGDADAIDAAIAGVDENLVAGIEAITDGSGPALLEAGFFRGRVQDAVERYHLGEAGVAVTIGQDLFGRFERNVADFHETFEETDHDAYEGFEEQLNALIDAFEAGDDGAVETAASGTLDSILDFESAVGVTAQVSGVEAGYMLGRGFDAATVAALGDAERADAIVEETFQHFEQGAGGFHEALEESDHDIYESFEDALGAINGADDRYAAARTYAEAVIEAIYTVVGASGGSHAGAAAELMQGVFAAFEVADVHELLEEADHDAYEGFEGALSDLIGALDAGTGVDEAADAFSAATLRAQFAVVEAIEEAPAADQSNEEDGGETDLQGGPNVVEGVPEDADHVIEMQAVSFDPAERTIQVGETVAWTHAGGEAHTVTAVEDDLPAGATYWASGGFESESAAREGWEDGTGAVQSGQSFVHTFETAGEHPYVCIPHEAAGMAGTVVVADD